MFLNFCVCQWHQRNLEYFLSLYWAADDFGMVLTQVWTANGLIRAPQSLSGVNAMNSQGKEISPLVTLSLLCGFFPHFPAPVPLCSLCLLSSSTALTWLFWQELRITVRILTQSGANFGLFFVFPLELQQQLLHAQKVSSHSSSSLPTCAELPPEQQKADVWEWKCEFHSSGKVLVQGKKLGSL